MTTAPPRRWPDRPGLLYGCDYNPEQWSETSWPDDVAMMRQAGLTMVSVGIFAWARLEPAEGQYEFSWLDRVLDLLHEGGIAVDLATGTASPPPWFSHAHPETLPVTADGVRLSPGSRQAYCPSSPVFRAATTRLARAMAEHYAGHPALAMWHVSNEYGCHNAHCYCDTSAAAFRRWLGDRYGDVAALNAAWGTAFWSQQYTDLEQVLPPRAAPSFRNPTQQLDYWRFGSDELLACYLAERDVLRAVTPDIPVTTNFMGAFKPVDSFAWAPELDVMSTDHYLLAEDPDNHIDLAMSADLTRSVAGGHPWLLMEHSTSAVNWQPRNLAKQPGQLRRNSLAHLARGADGLCFFQWKASVAGAEKYHSAMLPHAGTDTKVWRETVELGSQLHRLAELQGTTVHADVAVLWDWPNWWAAELDAHPSADLNLYVLARAYYTALWQAGITVDFVRPDADLSGYRLVVTPNLYLVDDTAVENLQRYVEGGGHLVLSFFSGIVDADDHVRPGGYPGAFRELVGASVEEFYPLRAGEQVNLTDGGSAWLWTELLHPAGAQVLASYTDGPLPGAPAVTRNHYGTGTVTYLTTVPHADSLRSWLTECATAAGVTGIAAPAGCEAVRRHGPDASYLFLLNHTDSPAPVDEGGLDLLTGEHHSSPVTVAPGDVMVLRQDPR